MAINRFLPNDFEPRPYQEKYMEYFDKGGKKAMWVVHRRGGKDLTAMHQTCKMAHKRTGVYWHIFPSFAQARKAIWEGFRKDGKRIMENVFPGFTDPKGAGSLVKRKDEQQLAIELKCGSIWRLLGSDRIELVGAGPVGVVYSEFAIANPRARNLIRPMLRENDGWEACVTTPRGNNHAKKLYDVARSEPGWFCDIQTVHDTAQLYASSRSPGRLITPDEMMMEEKAEGMPDALIQQEYMCDWNAALAGSVYGDLVDRLERLGGLESFAHEEDGVFTAWDLGMTDSTAIWFFRFTDEGLDVIDHYEAHGRPLSHYYDVIDSKPYKYTVHWLPHDARQVTLAAGVSILNQFMKKYPGKVRIGPALGLLDGIQAARWLFQQGMRLHPRCEQGIEALRQYHYEFDEEKKTFSSRPAHDWSSHSADSFRYMACVAKVSELWRPKQETLEAPKPIAKPLHYAVSLDQLFQDREDRLKARRRY